MINCVRGSKITILQEKNTMLESIECEVQRLPCGSRESHSRGTAQKCRKDLHQNDPISSVLQWTDSCEKEQALYSQININNV